MTFTVESAEALIAACVQRARDRGWSIGVAVADDHGDMLATRRATEKRAMTLWLAEAKAYTAAVRERPTRNLREMQDHQPALLLQLSQFGRYPLVPGDGGMPIKLHDRVLGGLGMSGATGEEDIICTEVLAELGYETDFDAPL